MDESSYVSDLVGNGDDGKAADKNATNGDSQRKTDALRHVRGYVVTNRGPVRQENQDSYAIIERSNFRLYAVADGMGGTQAGATASQIVVETLNAQFDQDEPISHLEISAALRNANKKIIDEASRIESRRGMGTTVALLACTDTGFLVANLGDSRVYCIRGTHICRLTEDHTVVNQLLKAGTLTKEQAKKNPFSNILTNFLGFAANIDVECWRSNEGLQANDKFVICSDGLHSTIPDSEILAVVRENPAEHAAAALVTAALKAGTTDNVTAIVVEVTNDFPGVRSKTPNKAPVLLPALESPSTVRKIDRQTSYSDDKWLPLSRRISWAQFARRPLSLIAFAFLLSIGFLLGQYVQIARLPAVVPRAAVAALVDSSPVAFLDGEIDSDVVRIGDVKAVASAVDALIAKGDLNALQSELDKLRDKIDLETRRIALWYQREQLIKQDTLALATEVGLTSPIVKELKDRFDKVHVEYLSQAEKLVYNPADLAQEKVVNDLAAQRKILAAQLKGEIEKVIRGSLTLSLNTLTELSRQRDRLDAAAQAKRRS